MTPTQEDRLEKEWADVFRKVRCGSQDLRHENSQGETRLATLIASDGRRYLLTLSPIVGQS